MVKNITEEMYSLVQTMKEYINYDIEDIKAARHEKLLERNDLKQDCIDKIVELKQNLNDELVSQMQNGVDINIYRADVDNLENELKKLYKQNARLAAIVLPIQQMYKEIVDEIAENNGGNLVEIKV